MKKSKKHAQTKTVVIFFSSLYHYQQDEVYQKHVLNERFGSVDKKSSNFYHI